MFSEIDTKRIIVKYRYLNLDLFNNLRNKRIGIKVEDPYC